MKKTKTDGPMTANEFRAEIVKIMPGFNWTVHKAAKGSTRLEATGIQSSGFNRLATLSVVRRIMPNNGMPWYEVKSAGYGTKAPWLGKNEDRTLARALRGLQDDYQWRANNFQSHANTLENARKAPIEA